MAIGGLLVRAGLGLAAGEVVNGRRTAQLASGWLTEAAWQDGTLTLTMNGNTYDYPDGDASLFEGVSNAPSPGVFYNQRIKGTSGNTGNRALGTVRAGLLAAGRGLISRGFGS